MTRAYLLACALAWAALLFCVQARADTRDMLAIACGPGHGDLAPLVDREARRQFLRPVLLVAVIARESGCRVDADSGRGDHGLGQIRLGGSAAHGASVEDLLKPERNIELTARHLANCLTLCGGPTGLSVYAGHRKCKSSHYARRVLATVARIARELARRAEGRS